MVELYQLGVLEISLFLKESLALPESFELYPTWEGVPEVPLLLPPQGLCTSLTPCLGFTYNLLF